MRKLLIAEADEGLCGALVDLLRRDYDITICSDGGTAVKLIRTLRPSVLILDLMLPVMDGFSILEEIANIRPKVILCISDFTNDYITQTARDLGVQFMIRKPCLPRVVVSRLEHLVNHIPVPEYSDGQSRAAALLLEFRFNPKMDGFRFLKIAIPLYAQDPQQRVCKELYVSIARICGAGSWNQVERSIRSAIELAWLTHAETWEHFFPGAEAPPTGKRFISRLAQTLMDNN